MSAQASPLSLTPPPRRTVSLEIVYRGFERTDAIDDRVAQHAQRLAAGTALRSCRVVIQASTHHAHGKPFHVRLELVLATRTFDINHEPSRSEAHADVFHALHEAFQCGRRRIEETARHEREEPRRRAAH